MKKDELEKFLDKQVEIFLSNNYKYSGKILEVNENVTILKDKFFNDITISNEFIAIIYEVEK